MAKIKRSEAYVKATISTGDNTIVEVNKDDVLVYSLSEFLERWNGIENVTISISVGNEIPVVEE